MTPERVWRQPAVVGAEPDQLGSMPELPTLTDAGRPVGSAPCDGHRAQLRVGSDGAVVVASAGGDRVAPSGGGVTQIVKVRVPDVDAAFARAREAGARVVEELTTWEYGERSGVVEDIGGHRWELTQTVRDVAPKNGVGRRSPPGESWVTWAKGPLA